MQIFKYCECGCKGYSARVCGSHYWVWWSGNEADCFSLRVGHGHTALAIADCPSLQDATNFAIEDAASEFNKNDIEVLEVLLDYLKTRDVVKA